MITPMGASLMEQFSDPNTMHSLSFGDKMAGSAITMVMGMGITFLVLIILWILILLMGKVLNTTEKKSDTPAATPVAATPTTVTPAAAVAEPVVDETNNQELVAVIAAAIAAMEGTTVDNLIVRRINRVSGQAIAWNVAGRTDSIESRRI